VLVLVSWASRLLGGRSLVAVKPPLAVVVVFAVLLSATLDAAPASARPQCPGRGNLRTYDLSCVRARKVLHRFFGGAPTVHPSMSPAGWRCKQRRGNHTSDGGSVFYVACREKRDRYVALHFTWTTDEGLS
jgi:hypothetical protein